jgi:C1A family cysteine protease
MKSLMLLGAAFFAANGLKDMDWGTEFTKENLNNLDTHAVFEAWHREFGRNYATQVEEARRYSIWIENLWKIADYNSRDLTFKLRLNQFGDLTEEEFRLQVHGKTGSCLPPREQLKPLQSVKNLPAAVAPIVDVPASVDWTTKGVVTPVKNQGQCGSCWAFSTTGSLECDYAIKTGSLVSLSEQQLVDCSSSYGNQGCNGGWYYYGWEYAAKEGGLCTEAAYPYTGVDGTCKTSCGTKYDAPKTYTSVTADDESALESAAAIGCVSVAIEADQFAFQYYSSGVLTGTCGTSIDHAVLVVGYGTESGQDYWKIKNSWGTTWGEEGYGLICRNCDANRKKGECGINMYPAYPNF